MFREKAGEYRGEFTEGIAGRACGEKASEKCSGSVSAMEA